MSGSSHFWSGNGRIFASKDTGYKLQDYYTSVDGIVWQKINMSFDSIPGYTDYIVGDTDYSVICENGMFLARILCYPSSGQGVYRLFYSRTTNDY